MGQNHCDGLQAQGKGAGASDRYRRGGWWSIERSEQAIAEQGELEVLQ